MKAQPVLENQLAHDSRPGVYSPKKVLLVFADGKTLEEWIEEMPVPAEFHWLNDKRKRPHTFDLRADVHELIYDERLF